MPGTWTRVTSTVGSSGMRCLKVILDKVGIAVRTQLEAVGDLAVGPEDVIFLVMTTVPFCVNGTPKSTSPGMDVCGMRKAPSAACETQTATELDSTGDRWNLMIRHHASKPEVANRRGRNA